MPHLPILASRMTGVQHHTTSACRCKAGGVRSHLEDPTSQQRGQSSYSEAGGAVDECCGGGVAQSV